MIVIIRLDIDERLENTLDKLMKKIIKLSRKFGVSGITWQI